MPERVGALGMLHRELGKQRPFFDGPQIQALLDRHKNDLAPGWKLRFTRPNPKGGLDSKGVMLVLVADQLGAIVLAANKMQDAVLAIDSEASAELLDQYKVKPGEMLVLMEGH